MISLPCCLLDYTFRPYIHYVFIRCSLIRSDFRAIGVLSLAAADTTIATATVTTATNSCHSVAVPLDVFQSKIIWLNCCQKSSFQMICCSLSLATAYSLFLSMPLLNVSAVYMYISRSISTKQHNRCLCIFRLYLFINSLFFFRFKHTASNKQPTHLRT